MLRLKQHMVLQEASLTATQLLKYDWRIEIFLKKYKAKEDKKNEITLLIYLAKADGKIEEEEKISLSEDIQNLDDFLNSEKKILFDLMNSPTLPELTKKEVKFSTKERAAEVMDKITNLAMADGEMADDEKTLIDKIKSMI